VASKGYKSNGFTLLEIIIAITILAIISTLTATNIQKSVKFKAKLDLDLADYAAVRDALAIISEDINKAFHWVDINEELKKKMISEAAAKGQPPPFATPIPGSVTAQTIPTEKLTAFVGDKESLYLTTLSHQRTRIDSAESDQAKIGYYIKEVKSMHDGKPTKALIRRESIILDDDVTKGGTETLLLENIKLLKFRYLGGDEKDWLDEWKSTSSIDSKFSNKFPEAVEISIETERDKRNVKLATVAAVHSPNNDLFANKTAASGSAGQNGSTTQNGATTTTTITAKAPGG
jgi:general secretion pathway protein J